MSKTNILGVNFDNVTPDTAARRVCGFLDGGGSPRLVVTPNPEMVMAAQTDKDFRRILNTADLCVPDGIGVVAASKILGGGLVCRVAGIELVEATFQRLSQEGRGCSVYLLGGKPGVARRAGLMLRRKYNAVSIAGTLDGYFGDDHAADIAAQIGSAAPDILLVGLGFPKQEKFIAAFKAVCRAKVSIGCGGSLDVFAGEVARAPRLVRRLGLEWLYRLAKQPSRLGRMMALPVFALLIIRDKFRRHKV